MATAVSKGETMKPHSANDKEYFAQDWFAARLKEGKLAYNQQGRNSYPDFLVTRAALTEGYELKALGFTKGKPARKDIDFNSTIPSGKKGGRDVFLVFFLYTGTKAKARTVCSLAIAHADLINSDHKLADDHVNVAIHGFGSYGDGFIRDRKMYVFPHPLEIYPYGIGRSSLILPKSWNISDPRIKKVGSLQRTVSKDEVDGFTIKLRGKRGPTVTKTPATNAGVTIEFDVFELV